MAVWPSFCSGTYQSRSPTLDAEYAINLFPITIESQANAKQKALMGTPGLRKLFEVSSVSCRGIFSEDGVTVAVIGGTVYTFDLTIPSATSLGSLTDDGLPVSFASNGRGGEQLAICGGGEVKVIDLTTMTLGSAVTLPLTNAPSMIDFIDGYGLVLEADTVKVYFSALEDLESWDALDFFARNQTSDNFVALKVVRDRIWVMGSETTEIYYDSGAADVPFVPYPGAILYEGIVGAWAWASDGESLFWLAQNNQGRAYMVQAQPGQSKHISTDAIDFALAQAPRLEDTETLAYAQEGHMHLTWIVPTACNCGRAYTWDTKEQLWHERSSWDQTQAQFYRWRARGVASTDQGIIVGDYADGNVYALDLDTFTENGALIRRVRRAPYASSENQIGFLDQIELGAQVGIGLSSGQGSSPTVMARVSRDGNQTWTPYLTASLGRIGEYTNRVTWRHLGRVRMDRFGFEVSITDPVRVVFGPGLWLRITQGTGQL